MNRSPIFAGAIVLALAAGLLVGRALAPPGDTAPTAETGEREILYWKAPMDPNYRRDEPGKSPMGMDLVPVYADEAPAEVGVVRINPAVVNNLGVRTAVAERGALSRRIDTVGYIGYDEDTVEHVHTRVAGWVEQLAVKTSGEAVSEGQLLFELYSPELVNAQEEYLAALRGGNAPLVDASRERLAALGVTDAQVGRLDAERRVDRRIRVSARRDGIVAELGVREGKYVTPDTDIMSIADLESVWVLVEVLERQSAWVREGLDAEVELDYLPGERWRAMVDYVYPELDPDARTLTVRLRLDNPGRRLRPNMFARVRIAGEPSPPVVHVPREALIRGGSVDRVVVALGAGHFRAQPVEAGIEAGDRVEIRRGLDAGQRIVTSGQFLIDSESNIDTALARLDEGDDAHAGHEMPETRTDEQAGHEMPAEEADEHAGHEMPETADGSDTQ